MLYVTFGPLIGIHLSIDVVLVVLVVIAMDLILKK